MHARCGARWPVRAAGRGRQQRGSRPHAISSQTVTTSSGSAQTTYGYNADGDLTIMSGTQSQSLTWDDAGRLSQLTTSSGTTGYIYDADGNLLLRKDPGSTTLYLPDGELVLDTGTGTVSGTRYYSIGGVTVATRTSAGDVQYLTGDQQGTETLAVDSSNLAVSERFYDPYGNPVGTATGTWPGDKGFQDGSADTSTGLDDLGASGLRCQRRRRRYPVGYSFLTMRSCVIWFREPNGEPTQAATERRWAIASDDYRS
jgi:YD repeat-containing protein